MADLLEAVRMAAVTQTRLIVDVADTEALLKKLERYERLDAYHKRVQAIVRDRVAGPTVNDAFDAITAAWGEVDRRT